ncbi:insulin-like 3 [Manis pentadactyla]|uniref:insulin-like 3 n=1 Tax=Manis pentadactyla TaxID=143292 RepID=UPI001873F327|nr:insulin-like 3 [Manis pentadactyla]
MDPRPLTWALVLLGPALAPAIRPVIGTAAAREAPEKLCGHHFVRALVRVCGGPRWSPQEGRPAAGGDRELLLWLEDRHLLHRLAADGDPELVLAPQLLPKASGHRPHRRAAVTTPARHCCLSGCTRQDLLILCPH